MPRQITKEQKLAEFAADQEGTLDERIRRHGLSRTMLELCKEEGCEEKRIKGSSRCERHKKQRV